MKKKFLTFMLAIALLVPMVLTLAGCGNRTPVAGDVYETSESKSSIVVDEAKFNAYLNQDPSIKASYEEIFRIAGAKTLKQKAVCFVSSGELINEKDLFKQKDFYVKLEFGDDNAMAYYDYYYHPNAEEPDRIDCEWNIYEGEEPEYAQYKGNVVVYEQGNLNNIANGMMANFEISGSTLVWKWIEDYKEYGINLNIVLVKK